MPAKVLVHLADASAPNARRLLHLVTESRNIEFGFSTEDSGGHFFTRMNLELGADQGDEARPTIPPQGVIQQLKALSSSLASSAHPREATALNDVYETCLASPDFCGLGFTNDMALGPKEEAEVMFLVSANLESLNSSDRSRAPLKPLKTRPSGRRGMTLSEKIFAAHDVDRKGEVKPGDVVRLDVDWILSSELSWGMGMERMYDELGKPGIFRNDRFWLAGDHLVDPRVMDTPKIAPLVAASERAREAFQMTEYQGMNYTIMHTEFCRERAQPGMLILGSDSHTCSAGSVGSLAVGLGSGDVTLPLITGQTWFRIPDSVNVRFINQPSPGIGGKDIILYVLKELKRNTVASDRVVEYTGPGLKHLSVDARFAISNMTTEFGGVTGIFVPDQITSDYIKRRKNAKYKKHAVFFRPDDDAEYICTHTIDLSKVESFVARYPAPDDVVTISEVEGKVLDGCFIGACTTTEEDLILGALILEAGLRKGMKPVKHGKRKVVPGSRPILNKLRRLGLSDVYQEAGFEVGVPGCSYCVGMSADKALAGEKWLTSQNRNFENRMGKGAFGDLASAATVAASSFEMKIANPKSLLDALVLKRLQEMLSHNLQELPPEIVAYVEPGENSNKPDAERAEAPNISNPPANSASVQEDLLTTSAASRPSQIRHGKVQRLGNFIDTDALAPTEAILAASAPTPEQFGKFCLIHTHPEFRDRVKQGYNVVVAGHAFGCGSSREVAVTALKGAGVQCVIAESFGFIYGRNQPNLGLLGITMTDPHFYEVAVDGAVIKIDLDTATIEVASQRGNLEIFHFQLSKMERQLIECGGMTEAFKKWGKGLWEILCSENLKVAGKVADLPVHPGQEKLQW